MGCKVSQNMPYRPLYHIIPDTPTFLSYIGWAPFLVMQTVSPAMVAISPSNVFYIFRNSALLGAVFHASTLGVEFELYLFHFLAAYTIAYVGFVSTLILKAGQPFLIALVRASLAFTSFNGGAFASIALYRLLIHRCREFDGPVLARLTRFHATYMNANGHHYSRRLGKYHEKYGDIVRTGKSNQLPRQLSRLT
jgi:hypothetical protein